MQIPQNLPQFEENKTFILVSSTQSADLHLAHEGQINQIEEVRTEPIDPDEQIGHFERKSQGRNLGSGGVYADKSKKLKDRFHNKLKDALNEIEESEIAQTILLSSPQDKTSTKKQFPDQLRRTIILEIDGNYVGKHPKEILEKVQDVDR